MHYCPNLFHWQYMVENNYKVFIKEDFLQMCNQTTQTGLKKRKAAKCLKAPSLRNIFRALMWQRADLKGSSLVIHSSSYEVVRFFNIYTIFWQSWCQIFHCQCVLLVLRLEIRYLFRVNKTFFKKFPFFLQIRACWIKYRNMQCSKEF